MSTVTPAKTYTVTINVAGAGAPTIADNGESGESRFGHMWYSLGDGTKEESYGFGPIEPRESSGPGERKRNDNALYPERYSRTIEITKAQYDAMKKFGENPAAGQTSLPANYQTTLDSVIAANWK